MNSLSLISLNIERDKHLKLVLPFLRERKPDVTCIQELFDLDVPAIEEALGATCYFVPENLYPSARGATEGIGIFTRLPVSNTHSVRYAGNPGPITMFKEGGTPEEKTATQSYSLGFADVLKDGVSFRVSTTHFPWTPDGNANDIQREAVESMLRVLGNEGELVLCGDFNAPRGGEIFSAIAGTLKDNVPERYETSIDGNIHRAGPLPYMVDGLFTTNEYVASSVELLPGISDHCALVSIISKI